MQDAFNLAWKIAYAVKGYAGPGLLESYSPERVPVGRQIVARANQSRKDYAGLREWFDPTSDDPVTAGLITLKAPSPEGAALRERLYEALEVKNTEFNAHGVELNQRYASSAVVPDLEAGEEVWGRDRELYLQATTRPGAKLPHAWLVGPDGTRVSTLDVTGKGQMTLLTGIGGQAWKRAAATLDLPFLRTIVIGEAGINDSYGTGGRSVKSMRPELFSCAPTATSPGGTALRYGTTAKHSPTSRTRSPSSSTAPRTRPQAPGTAVRPSTAPTPYRSSSRTSPPTTQHQPPQPASHQSREHTHDPPVHQRLGRSEPGRVQPGVHPAGPYRTRYLHAGDDSKPTLIFLHGITGHAEAYVRNLRSHSEHFNVWAIDFIGHGYSAKPDHPLEIKHYIDHVLHLMDAIGVEKASFSGESLADGSPPSSLTTTRTKSRGSCSTPWAAPWPTHR